MALVDMLIHDPAYSLHYIKYLIARHRMIPRNLYRILPKETLERMRRQWKMVQQQNQNTRKK